MKNCQKIKRGPSRADNINPGYLNKRKRNRNLFSLVVNSRPLKGAWPKESGVKWGGSPITIYDRMKKLFKHEATG